MARKITIVIVALIVVCTIGLIAVSFGISNQNDKAAQNIVEEIKSIPVPDNTSIVEEISDAGKLSGNGEGMQYFGAVLLKSELSLEELQTYYGKYSESKYSNIVACQEGNRVKVVEHKDLQFKTEIGKDNDYYIVYTWGDYDGVASELDLRGIG